jgi:hypothetical protein
MPAWQEAYAASPKAAHAYALEAGTSVGRFLRGNEALAKSLLPSEEHVIYNSCVAAARVVSSAVQGDDPLFIGNVTTLTISTNAFEQKEYPLKKDSFLRNCQVPKQLQNKDNVTFLVCFHNTREYSQAMPEWSVITVEKTFIAVNGAEDLPPEFKRLFSLLYENEHGVQPFWGVAMPDITFDTPGHRLLTLWDALVIIMSAAAKDNVVEDKPSVDEVRASRAGVLGIAACAEHKRAGGACALQNGSRVLQQAKGPPRAFAHGNKQFAAIQGASTGYLCSGG